MECGSGVRFRRRYRFRFRRSRDPLQIALGYSENRSAVAKAASPKTLLPHSIPCNSRRIRFVGFVLTFLTVFAGCATQSTTVVSATSPTTLHDTQKVTAVVAPSSPAATVESQANATDRTRSIALSEAIRIGLESNLDLALARAQHEIAQARAMASTGAFIPTLDVGAGTTRIDGLVQGAFGDFRDIDSRGKTAGLAFGLRVNIGARVCESIAARRECDAALLGVMASEQKLILSIVELYENLVLAKVSRDIAQQLVQSSGEFDRIASTRYQGGVGLGSDAARATANLAASKQQLVQAEKLWRTTSVRLAVVLRLDPKVLLDPADTQIEPWQLPPDFGGDAYAENAANRPDVQAAHEQADAAKQLLRARWWDLAAPELYAEWRLTGIGGTGDTAEPDDGAALSSAAGSVGRSAVAWRNTGNAIVQGTDPIPPFTSAASSGGRAYYAYKNLIGSTQQEIDSLERQERYGIGLNWNLSFAKAARIREQRTNAQAAGLRAQKAEDAAIGEVRQAQDDVRAAIELITLAQDEIVSIESSHRMSLARFTGGTALAFEVLDAQDALTEARLKLARYTTDLNVAQARLLAASGIIEQGNVGADAPAP